MLLIDTANTTIKGKVRGEQIAIKLSAAEWQIGHRVHCPTAHSPYAATCCLPSPAISSQLAFEPTNR